METHVRLVAWLRIGWSVVGLLVMLAVLVFFRTQLGPMVQQLVRTGISTPATGSGAHDREADAAEQSVDEALTRVVPVMTVGLAVMALFQLLAAYSGWALLKYRPWARPVNIVLSIFDLLSIPVGTIIGGYSLWVMFRQETVELFERGPSPERYPAHF